MIGGKEFTGFFLASVDHAANIAVNEGKDVMVYTKRELERVLSDRFRDHAGESNHGRRSDIWEIYCTEDQPQSTHWSANGAKLAHGDPKVCRRLITPDTGAKTSRVSKSQKSSQNIKKRCKSKYSVYLL